MTIVVEIGVVFSVDVGFADVAAVVVRKVIRHWRHLPQYVFEEKQKRRETEREKRERERERECSAIRRGEYVRKNFHKNAKNNGNGTSTQILFWKQKISHLLSKFFF